MCRCDNENATKSTTVNVMPQIVASCLVNRLMMAMVNRAIAIRPRPTGISLPPIRGLNGTRHSRAPGTFWRSTSIARLCRAKLQMTPKA